MALRLLCHLYFAARLFPSALTRQDHSEFNRAALKRCACGLMPIARFVQVAREAGYRQTITRILPGQCILVERS
jgi:hypothetical protein